MKNSTNNKQYGMFTQSVSLPNGKWVIYYCFRSTVSLDAAMFLFKKGSIRKAVNEGHITFDPSYFRTKASKIYPGVQIGAAFTTQKECDAFDVAWNEGMANAEIRRIQNARINSGGPDGGTFMSRFIDKNRSAVWTAKELVKEFFEGEYMSEMNKLIKDTERVVEVREQECGAVSDHEVCAYDSEESDIEFQKLKEAKI
jgi:hypothetical protein